MTSARRSHCALALAFACLLLVLAGRCGPEQHTSSLDQHAVRAAAAQCHADPTCVPSVDKLVRLASRYCAKEPSCVCNWGAEPRACFLAEVLCMSRMRIS
jgi:hypothetical protein